MFPLKTLPNARQKPILTRVLIGLNVLAFAVQTFDWWRIGLDWSAVFGIRPTCYTVPSGCGVEHFDQIGRLGWPLLAALFLHGDLVHLAFNMLFLGVFGGGLEDRIGRFRFLMVYFGGAFVATFAHILSHPTSAVPTIGASGAIAAVLGAYFIAQPKGWGFDLFSADFLFSGSGAAFFAGLGRWAGLWGA